MVEPIEEDVLLAPHGLALRVLRWGPAEPERIVLVLHGYLEQGMAWIKVVNHLLGPGVGVVAPDHRGHGRSPGTPPGFRYHFWDYVADVDALVRGLGVSQIDLLGHSMGGTIASVYAGARPDRVRRLVLVEGLGPPDTRSVAVARGRAFLDDLAKVHVHKPLGSVAEAEVRLRRTVPGIPPDLLPRLAARLLGPDGRWTWDPLHRVTFPVPFDAEVFGAWLREITAPVLAVRGADSPFATFGLERADALRDVRQVVIPGAGHMVHHDQPAALADAVRDFFEISGGA